MKKLILITFIFLTNTSYAYIPTSVLYKQGTKLALQGKIDRAIIVFKKVIKRNPYYSLGYYGLGKAYLYKFGMNKEAIKNLRKSVQYDKRFVKGYFYLGIAYYLGKKYIPAIHAFHKAYKLDKYNVQALYNIGAMYDVMKNEYKAGKYFKLYLKGKNKDDDEITFP